MTAEQIKLPVAYPARIELTYPPEEQTTATHIEAVKAWYRLLFMHAPGYVIDQLAHTAAQGDNALALLITDRLIDDMSNVYRDKEINYTKHLEVQED